MAALSFNCVHQCKLCWGKPSNEQAQHSAATCLPVCHSGAMLVNAWRVALIDFQISYSN